MSTLDGAGRPAGPGHAHELLDVLRQTTRILHRRLDSTPLLAALVKPGATSCEYQAALGALAAPRAALEEVVGGHAGLAAAVPPRLPDLLADLDDLGCDARVPVPPPVHLGHPTERVGVAYVLHGSRLGARGIARAVRRSLGDAAPLRYFGDWSLDRAQWQATWPQLASHCAPGEVPHAVRGAIRAFDRMLSDVSAREAAPAPGSREA